MDMIPAHFKINLAPVAVPQSIVKTEHARFTILTPRMIRMEWSPTGNFENRASQPFWYRAQTTPEFSAATVDGRLVIETAFLRLQYQPDQAFTPDNLEIELKKSDKTWHFGDLDEQNLGGTARTVDGIDGSTPLSMGLISRAGWSVVDDSNSLVFDEVGWLQPRGGPSGQLDLYFLGYGHDYQGCLTDFNKVAGSVPMIPRYVLGNWWSRYWAYTQAELQQLMEDFQAHEVPLSVCIIDMDWHITKTNNASRGWTGYTWNRELFPDPEGALRFFHEKGLKVALNLHPADGVYPHEEMYQEMSEAVGNDPTNEEPVEFDITNPRFVEAYFRILHHPQEARGIDFWWMDWQQGVRTRLSGLDPLWWLNHLHFLDLGRDGKRRSFIFSRWGGLGNHRYPIGFSGDSVITWASLAFQPFFTSTSSNVNYGWWSHDIGGHMSGVEDAELYTRWVQLGVFQPVLRLHSTNNPYHERRPWGYDAETFAAAQYALQLRHALIPYLYSLAWRYHKENVPPILPMYYPYPEQEEAYAVPNQYQFGGQLVVAPFITPHDPDTRLSRSVVWLPEGDWYNYFSGQYFQGGGVHAVYGTLRDIPVFAKAGSIIPTGPMAGWDNFEAPDHLIVNVFPGADGAFNLYEDEGNSNAYLDGAYAITPLGQSWAGDHTTVTIGPADGTLALVPASRQVDLCFRGIALADTIEVHVNGAVVPADTKYDPESKTLVVSGITISPADTLEVTLTCAAGSLAINADRRIEACLKLIRNFRLETNAKSSLAADLPRLIDQPQGLGRFASILAPVQMRALLETITGAGIDTTDSTGEQLVVMWNNANDPQVTQLFALARVIHWYRFKEHYPSANGVLPHFHAFHPKKDFGEGNPWVMQVQYYGVNQVQLEG